MISQETQCESLHATLKDLTSVLQALGRLAEHFSCDRFTERMSEAQQLMNQYVRILLGYCQDIVKYFLVVLGLL